MSVTGAMERPIWIRSASRCHQLLFGGEAGEIPVVAVVLPTPRAVAN